MIARRDLVMGGVCLAAAGAAYGLKPRRELLLLPKTEKLEDLVPMQFSGWSGQDVGDPLALNPDGSLAARLYNQLVVRLYSNLEGDSQVMMLLAYGEKQNDDLQLHRPEVCYPAFGYTLTSNERAGVPLSNSVQIPARRLVARNDQGEQFVTYWARLGEYLPQDGGQQREARFKNALSGLVPDGVLCRFSTWAPSAGAAWRITDSLVGALVANIRADRRSILIGTERATALTVRQA